MIIQPNPIMIFVAALVPVVIGFIWFNPSLFGKTLAHESNSKVIVYGPLDMIVNYIFGLLLSFSLLSYVNHQMAVMQLFYSREGFNEPGSKALQDLEQVLRIVGDYHLSFGHGAIHGTMAAVMLLLPVIVAIALRERRTYKYVFIHFGFWLVSAVLMGGILGQWGLHVNL